MKVSILNEIKKRRFLLEVEWEKINIFTAFKLIRNPKITKTIYTDASREVWMLYINTKIQLGHGSLMRNNNILIN